MNTLVTDNLRVLTGTANGFQRLRELILDLAVRGRLVPQDATDEPASVLLQRIDAEKARLVKEKEIGKRMTFSAVGDDEKGFDLPQGWEWTRLGVLVNSLISGGTPSKSNPNFWNGSIPWASVKDLNVDRDLVSTKDMITNEGLAAGSKLARAGDVVICTRMGLGKIAVAARDVAINQDLKAVRISSCINVDYFLCSYRTLKIEGIGMTVAGIRQDVLLNYVIALPPVSEQNRIVAKVDELMALCDRLEARQSDAQTAHAQLVQALLDTLTYAADAEDFATSWQRLCEHFHTLFTTEASIDALKQAVLQLAVTGKLVSQDQADESAKQLIERIAKEKARLVTEGKLKKQKDQPAVSDSKPPHVIPASWAWSRIGDLALDTEYGLSDKTSDTIEGVPVVKMGDIQRGRVVLGIQSKVPRATEGLSKLFLDTEDLLYNRTNSAELVGKTGIFSGPAREYSYASYLIRIRCLKDLFSPAYLNHSMNAPGFREYQINPHVKQQCGQANVNGTIMRGMLVPVPPFAEQQRIVAKVDQLMVLCEQLRARLVEARQTNERLADALVGQAVA